MENQPVQNADDNQLNEREKQKHFYGEDKSQYKPEGYQAIVYQPAHKVEDETKLSKIPQDKLQKAYSLWVLVREQNFVTQVTGAYDPSELQEVTSFNTVQQFWAIYQHLRRPTAMPYGTTLHIFQQGIKPAWEEPALVKGCRITIKAKKNFTSKWWEDLLLAVIGEQVGQNSGLIAGLVLNLKPQFDKISLWITDCEKEDEIKQIKNDLLEILKIEDKELEYEIFRDLSKKTSKTSQPNQFSRGRGGLRGNRGVEQRGAARGGFRGARPSVEGGFERNLVKNENNFYRADKGTERKEEQQSTTKENKN